MLQAIFGIDTRGCVPDSRRQPVVESITCRRSTTAYPDFFAVEIGSVTPLHAIVRTKQPDVMIETGVADGFSTAVILAAMETNGRGELHSYDIADDVGACVTDRTRWTLHIREPLPSSPIDLFLHDSDHSYANQSAEYVAAWSILRPGGLLLSDDVDWSCAFLDFAFVRMR